MAGAATAVAVAAVPVLAASPASAATATGAGGTSASTASLLRRHNFTPLLQRTFQLVDRAGTSTTVTLTKIDDLSPEPSPGTDVRFSLMFEGASTGALAQGTYQLRQRALGTVQVLVVPVGAPAARAHYQVVVNNRG